MTVLDGTIITTFRVRCTGEHKRWWVHRKRAGKDTPLIPAAAAYNRRHAAVRAPGERGFATLKCWQILTRVRCTVSKTGAIAQAILALHRATSTPIRMK
ncbi:transposase family protein [Catellatospora sichuanensis]|uniref:transposase family protein n=1 Tax=Catellatospora sichuanensis TaxID=1969805 RepID=UPI001642FF2C|nr:transposase family protein [Catellatospora sichuanensis]